MIATIKVSNDLMQIRENYGPGKFGLSIEIFPPKTPAGDLALFENLDRLVTYQPGFISCTYGAGGSTSQRTVELCVEIQRRSFIEVDVAHGAPPVVGGQCAVVARGEFQL